MSPLLNFKLLAFNQEGFQHLLVWPNERTPSSFFFEMDDPNPPLDGLIVSDVGNYNKR